MKARLLLLPLLGLLGSALAAPSPQVHVIQAWSRATPPGTEVAVGYLSLRNAAGKPLKLVGASSPRAGAVEMHETRIDAGVSRMRPVKEVSLPADAMLKFEPGGRHLMLVGLTAPLKAGERVPLTLRFEGAAPLEVQLEVRPLGAAAPTPADQHKHR